MKMPCDNAIRCPSTGFPIANFSSEEPDHTIYLTTHFGQPIPGPGPGPLPPHCIIFGQSIISVVDVEACTTTAWEQCSQGVPIVSTIPGCIVTPIDPNPPVPPKLPNPNPSGGPVATPFSGFTCENFDYTFTLMASGASPFVDSQGLNPHFNWTVTDGTFPPGLTLDLNGFIHGQPTTAGVYSFKVTVADSQDRSNTQDMTFTVLGILNDSLPSGTVGVAYSQQLDGEGGADEFFLSPGTFLPPGLTLSDTGLISGTPTTAGSNVNGFDVGVVDSFLNTCYKHFQITVNEPTTCPNWSTLFWGPDLGSPGGGGTQNSSPTNAAGATFHLDASIAGIFDFAGGQIRSTIPYNGPGCHCKLHFSWTENQPHAGAVNSWGISVDVRYGPCPNPAGYRNATDAFGCTTVLLEVSAPTSANPQTIDLPFDIPDTGGSTMYIFLDALIGINGATAGLYTVSMDGTFSNV